ncbi:MAG: Maf family protein [Candidatus Helarchaeota archaeon]
MKKIVLASKSPRRINYLKMMKIPFEVRTSSFDEEDFKKDNVLGPIEHARYLALKKAESVFKKGDYLVIGADTVVSLDGEIFGKPKDEADAISMLKKLRGRLHQVVTAIAFVLPKKQLIGHEITVVKFKDLSDSEIKNYVALKESFDAAGAYKIQENAGNFIEFIKGDRDNVVGFPLKLFKVMLNYLE